jgi:hypothetical protein
MLVLTYIKAILKNPYFYIEPYLHQILTLILSLLLMDYNNSATLDLVIYVKDYAVDLLKELFVRYEIKYPSFKIQLLQIFKDNLDKQSLFNVYGAIKGINALGPAYVIDLILPKMDAILQRLNINYTSLPVVNKNYNPENEKMQVDDQQQNREPITFSQNLVGTLQVPIASSMFSEISHTNIIPGNYENDRRAKSIVIKDDKNAYYVYYVLKVISWLF